MKAPGDSFMFLYDYLWWSLSLRGHLLPRDLWTSSTSSDILLRICDFTLWSSMCFLGLCALTRVCCEHRAGGKKAAFRGPLGEHYSAFTCITVVNRPYLELNELNEYSALALMWFERQICVHSLWAVTQRWRASVCEELGSSSLHLLLSPQLTPLYTVAKTPTDKTLT